MMLWLDHLITASWSVQSPHQNFLSSLTSEASKVHQSLCFALHIAWAFTRRKSQVQAQRFQNKWKLKSSVCPSPFGETAFCGMYQAIGRVLHPGKMQCWEGLWLIQVSGRTNVEFIKWKLTEVAKSHTQYKPLVVWLFPSLMCSIICIWAMCWRSLMYKSTSKELKINIQKNPRSSALDTEITDTSWVWKGEARLQNKIYLY